MKTNLASVLKLGKWFVILYVLQAAAGLSVGVYLGIQAALS